MNKYQKIGFGTFAVLAVAWTLQDRLTALVVVAGVIALMTLATTWWLVFTATQGIGLITKLAGNGVRYVGQTFEVGSANIKAHLIPKQAVAAPIGTHDFDPAHIDLSDFAPDTADDRGELDVPSFMDDVMSRQN